MARYCLLAGFDYPVRHGMTVGELALMYNEEKKIGAQLTVIPFTGWDRSMFYEQTGLVRMPPSPNIPAVDSALYFATTGLMQAGNFSHGLGTTTPFQYVGEPSFDGEELAKESNNRDIPGVFFVPKYYKAILGGDNNGENVLCSGVMTILQDWEIYRPLTAQLHIMDALCKMYPQYVNLEADKNPGRKRMGTHVICDLALKGESLLPVIEDWQAQAEAFMERGKPWLLYK